MAFWKRSGIFQSTLSVRRATKYSARSFFLLCISIHALRKESDPIDTRAQDLIAISIHALRKESDLLESVHFIRLIAISIHALRKESDSMTVSRSRR